MTNKILPAMNSNNGTGSSKKVIQSPYKEMSNGCGCGVASCENCPGCLGMEMGPDRKVVYRSVFSYLRIVTVILVAACILEKVLTSVSI